METELKQINLILALCWPNHINFKRILKEQFNYEIYSIEPHFKIAKNIPPTLIPKVFDKESIGSDDRNINPDLLLISNNDPPNILIIECASGRIYDRKEKQLKKYQLIEEEDLITQLAIPSPGRGKRYTINPVVVVEDSDINQFYSLISQDEILNKSEVVLISTDYNCLKLEYGRFADAKLHNAIAKDPIKFDGSPPVSLCPICRNSSDKDFINELVRVFNKFQLNETRDNFYTDNFIEEIFQDYIYSNLDSNYMAFLSQKINKLLSDLSNNALKGKISLVSRIRQDQSSKWKWKILEKPFKDSKSSSTTKFKATQRKVKKQLEKYLTKDHSLPEDVKQLPLFTLDTEKRDPIKKYDPEKQLKEFLEE